MAARCPYLRRRGGRYYFRQRVPLDIADRFPVSEVTHPLRTVDFKAARRRAILLAMSIEAVFERVRRDRTLTRQQIEEIARDFLRSSLEADDALRAESPPSDPDQHVCEMAEEAANWADDLRYRYRKKIEPIADQIIEWGELPVTKGSEAYRTLCDALIRAQIERYTINAARSDGDYGVVPQDILFRGYEAVPDPAPNPPSSEKLSAILDSWMAERKPTAKTNWEWRRAFRLFQELHGDLEIH